jgi:3',5'-nucleoside bisphosphate phosphatase
MRLKNPTILFFLLLIALFSPGQSRKIIHIPDIPGYETLKCDFHIHTVFSDGTVWPTVRIEEAWREGLDVISITDHIEYRPHSKDIVADHNRSFEIAGPLADKLNIVLVQGAEITRSMPPGHLNALFVKNANLLDREDVFDALKEAREQGAFILWNHPGWKSQQPDTTLWWEEHTRLLNKDLLHGIELYNYKEYYPEAIDWALGKKLTMFGNSDIHSPIGMAYDLENSHRPLTLVFARSRNEEGVREALFSRRTAVYFDNTLMGKSSILEPLFFESLEMDDDPLRLKNGVTRHVEIQNNSDVDYELERVQPGIGFDAPESVVLEAHRITSLELKGNSDQLNGMDELNVYYKVKNMEINSNENLVVTFSFPNN